MDAAKLQALQKAAEHAKTLPAKRPVAVTAGDFVALVDAASQAKKAPVKKKAGGPNDAGK